MNGLDVKILQDEECRENIEANHKDILPKLGPNTICAKSEQDLCKVSWKKKRKIFPPSKTILIFFKVDYGSALACEDSNGQYNLVGIYNWETGCGNNGQIGGFLRPDNAWIQKSLRTSPRELRKAERQFLGVAQNWI